MTMPLLLEHFDELLATPEDVEQLNSTSLQLALQGKLVKQNLSDESGLELLKHIFAERTDGSRRVHLAPIKESEKPYVLPAGWAWARLGDIIQISSGNSLTKEQMNETGNVPVYGGNGITGYHDEALVHQKTIVIGRVGFYCGSVHLTEDKAWVTDNAFITTYPEKYIHREYLIWLLKGTNLKENENATAQPVISGRKIYPIVIGIPPLLEQKRIAARLEELFAQTRALAKELEHSQSELDGLNKSALSHLLASETPEEFNQHWEFIAEHFDLLFQTPEHIAPLRQSILELAVRGKLTRREAGDESAGELLKQIHDEQIERGIEIDLQPVKDSDKPFELPDGWEWARFPELGELGRGKSKHRPRNAPFLFEDGKYPFVQTGDVAQSNGRIKKYSAMYSEQGLAQSRMWKKGTLCITIAANIAETGILEFDACFPDSVVGFVPSPFIGEADYFQYFVKVAKSRLESYAPATAQKNINLGILQELLIPLPPANELKRIVKRVEQLLSLCDALEGRLQSAEEERGRLVAAVMSTVNS